MGKNREHRWSRLQQVKASVVQTLLLAYCTLLGVIAIWHLGAEVVSLRFNDIAWSWTRPTADRVRVVLREQHTTSPETPFDAYELIRQHTAAGDKVYLLRDFDLLSLVTFYRLMSLLYPRELFPIRELGTDWAPQEHRDGQRVFILDYSSVLTSDPRFTILGSRGSCKILAQRDKD